MGDKDREEREKIKVLYSFTHIPFVAEKNDDAVRDFVYIPSDEMIDGKRMEGGIS